MTLKMSRHTDIGVNREKIEEHERDRKKKSLKRLLIFTEREKAYLSSALSHSSPSVPKFFLGSVVKPSLAGFCSPATSHALDDLPFHEIKCSNSNEVGFLHLS